jgi:hypothetical protein
MFFRTAGEQKIYLSFPIFLPVENISYAIFILFKMETFLVFVCSCLLLKKRRWGRLRPAADASERIMRTKLAFLSTTQHTRCPLSPSLSLSGGTHVSPAFLFTFFRRLMASQIPRGFLLSPA